MATFDQLSAEQRAIIELVLKQGQSYDELSDMLGLSTSRGRELAREALVRLSPVSASAVEEDWRAQLADYMLNQQSGPESTATRGHLRRSEASRGWARSVLDSLEQFYDEKNLPSIPEGDRAAEAEPRRERRPRREKREKREPREKRPARPAKELSSGAQAAIRRRRLVGGGALAALLLALVLLVWPVGLLTGGDDDPASAGDTQNAAARPQLIGQLPLGPVESLEGSQTAQGAAGIVQSGDVRQLVVRAQLPRSRRGEAYEVWLYNSDEDAQSIGAQITDQQGVFSGAKELPEGYERYEFIDVSRETVTGPKAHSGDSVLRGALAELAPVDQNAGSGTETAPAPEQEAP